MPEFHLERARTGDELALAELQRDAQLAALTHIFPPERYPYPFASVVDSWRTTLADPSTEVTVAAGDDRPLGVVAATPGQLLSLYIHPTRWGTGLARRLHEVALDIQRRAGVDRCELWVLEDNHRARRFYERHGWQPDGRTARVPFPPEPTRMGYQLVVPATR